MRNSFSTMENMVTLNWKKKGLKKVWDLENGSRMSRECLENGSKKSDKCRQRFSRSLMLPLIMLLTLGVGSAWGADFTPAQIASGTTTSGISVSSSFSKSTSQKLCTSQTSEDAIQLNSSAGGTYNDKYIWITVPANCKITNVGVLAKANGTTACTGGVVYWSGVAATDGVTSTETLAAGSNGTSDCTGKTTLTVPANTRTVGIYRAPKIKNNAFNGSGTVVGGTSTFKVFALSVTAQGTVTHTLSNVTKSSGNTYATLGSAYSASYAASDGYTLPSTITVTINGSAATAGTDYTWNSSTGAFTVPAAKVNGAIVITITGEAAAAGSGWGIAGTMNSWTAASNEMTGSGTVSTTISLSANTDYEFKIVDMNGGATWYGHSNSHIGGNVSGVTFYSSGDYANNCHLLTTEAGTYTFTFNTSTKQLSVTYPNSYTFYYANTNSWSNVYVYKFTSISSNTGTSAAWPGTKIASPAYTCGGTDYYEATSDGYAKLIFTNNGGGDSNQTSDMTVSSSDAGKYTSGNKGAGTTTWSAWPTYTISYNNGGGTGSMSSQSSIACGTDKATTANSFTAPSGYQFAGWKANVDVTVGGSTKTAGTVLADGVTIQNVSSNITLTAQWELIPTYDVIYNTNGGMGGSTASQTGNLSGAQVTTSANGFTKTGYKFKWWNTAANGSGEDFYPGEKVTIASADVNLYAQWEQVESGWELWCGSPNTFTSSQVVVGDMVLTKGGANVAINTDLTADPTIVSKYNSSVDKHAICIAVPNNDQYIQVSFSDGSPINTLKLWATTNKTDSKNLAIIYSTTADFSTGEYEAKTVSVPASNAASKALTDFSPATADKYFYARIYRKVETAVYGFTGGSGNTARIYGVKAQKGANCTAPSALTAASPTAKGITLSVTDANDVNDYEFYVSTSSTAPEAGATATHSVSSAKSLTITNLVAGTTYYAWARSVCGVSNKSGWTALTGSTFTTSTVTMTPTLTNVTKSSGATSGIGGSDYTAVFTASTGYSMPNPTVTIGGNAATIVTDYTWSVEGAVGTITIPANKINGNIAITLNSAKAAPSSVSIDGTWHPFPGETITLTATPTGGNGPKTYQWYKGEDAIDGATNATYTKASCAYEDAGDYWCTVTCGGTESTSSGVFQVKILRLYVKTGRYDGYEKADYGNVDFTKVDGSTATASINLGANWDYCFNIADGCGHAYGYAGEITVDDCTDWTINVNNQDCGLRSTNGAYYLFTIDYSAFPDMVLTVTYPTGDQAADKIIYFDNQTVNWSTLHYRVGKTNHTQATAMTKVPGTNNLWKVTTTEYLGFAGWHIANNAGWTGSNSIYRTYTNGDAYSITKATAHEGGAVTQAAVTVTPTTWKDKGGDAGINDNCDFYNYSITSGMKTQNVAISPYSNGTITVNYTNTSNVASTLTSGNADLAHSVILTSITAVPNTGYDASAITINGGAYSANYVVTGATTIAASFTPHTYSITYKDQGDVAFSGTHVDSPNAHPTTHTYATATTLNSATKTGYTFGGWFTNSACTGEAVASLGATAFSADIMLYAKWTAKNYKISLDQQSATTPGTTSIDATYGSSFVQPAELPEKTGYDFGGYYTETNGGGLQIINGSGFIQNNKSGYTDGSGNWIYDGSTTLYAKWTVRTTSVTLNPNTANHGTGSNVVATATFDGTSLTGFVAATPASGYSLVGYYTGATSGEKILNADGSFVRNTTYSTDEGTPKWKSEDATLTLYAQYEANTYSVTYNANGATSGTVPTDATVYMEGDTVTVKGNTGSLTKTGKTFVGWSTSSTYTGGTFYPADYKFLMPSSNVTLYAVWATGRICYTITDFETSNHNKSDNKPDSQSKYLYGYMGTKDEAHALTLTSDNSNTKGQNSGVELRLDNSATLRIYANNVTNATPTTFTDVTSVSFGAKLYNSSGSERTTSYTIKVGSTTVGSGSITGQASDGYFDITTGSFSAKNGYVEIIVGSGNSNNNLYIDNIEICTGSGSMGYTVTFDKNGEGSYSRTIENVPSGSKISAPIPAPTAPEQEFDGWYREAGCTNAWDFAAGTITADTTLYAKWAGCTPTISVHPVSATYVQGAAATALSVTATGEGVLSYQWYSNESNSNEGGATIPSATSSTYTPSSALIGSTYYYCVVSNACGNTASNTAKITINDSRPLPTAVWTGTEESPKSGGKGWTVTVAAKKDDGSTKWDGDLTTSMLSASAGVTLSGLTVDNTAKTISGTYSLPAGVGSPITFTLTLPATGTQGAAALTHDVSFTPCAGGAGDSYNVRVRKNSEKDASNNYRWVTAGAGEITYAVGSSISSAKASSAVGVFDSIMSSDKQYVWVKTYVANTKTVRLHVLTSGANISINTLYKNITYAAVADKDIVSTDDYSVSYDGSGSAENTGTKGTHYVDITFDDPLAANDIICIKFSSSKVKAYGAVLTTVGDGGDQTTALSWSNSQASGATLEKSEDAADFAVTAVRDAVAEKSLGAISYTSSNTSIATVNASTGQVHIADGIDFGDEDYKTTTITATLAASGCYKKATITYILQVDKHVCSDAQGTITYVDRGCSGMDLTLEGYEAGATIQWYKDGAAIPSATDETYTATEAGEYYAVSHKTCDMTSTNSIKLTNAGATAEKIVDEWYVKNERRTPDIALVQTTGATGFTVVNNANDAAVSDLGGCTFELKDDGIIYLHGTKPNGDAPSGMDAGDIVLKITATACSNATPVTITIHRQAATAKPSVAFVVDGTSRDKGGTATSVAASKTTSRTLWTYLSSTFDLTGCNAYWSVDSKELRQYYSQYDAILITDDPNTTTAGAGGVSYVKAFGTMMDVRPILTLEAYVGRWGGGAWGMATPASPESPNPRQVTMKLDCRSHEIFSGISESSKFYKRDIDGDDYWFVTMVDTALSPYHGTTKSSEELPALQGFDATKFSNMLGLGKIHDDKLQGGVERQEEPAARMVILGINNQAMDAMTDEGKAIIKNTLTYLLKTNMEDVDDCSNYFVGGVSGYETDWTVGDNWTKREAPDFSQRARILAPAVIPAGTIVRVARVDIVDSGTSKVRADNRGVGTCDGSLTIDPLGALVVAGTVKRAVAPAFGIEALKPTTENNILLRASASGSGSLIIDNKSGDTKATVQLYCKAGRGGGITTWQYIGTPFSDVDNAIEQYYGSWLYKWKDDASGWEKVLRGGAMSEFVGYCLTQNDAGHLYSMEGTLVETDIVERDVAADKNMVVANSWTAPIQIDQFTDEDFEGLDGSVYFFNTGKDIGGTGEVNKEGGRWEAGTYVSVPIHSAPYTGDSKINAMQGFFVKSDGSAGKLTMDYDRIVRPSSDNRTNVDSEPLHAPRRAAAKSSDNPIVLKMYMCGAEYDDRLVLLEHSDFTTGYDFGWDGEKWEGGSQSPMIYVVREENTMEAVSAVPELDGTLIGIRAGEDSEYTIRFDYDEAGGWLYLLDIETNNYTRVLTDNTYTFSVGDQAKHTRFLLTRNAPTVPTELGETGQAEKAVKFISNDKLFIYVRGVLYDVNGKVISK